MTPAANIMGKILSLALFSIVAIQTFWMIYPGAPISYSDLKILTSVVMQGKEFGFSVTLQKTSVYPATISRILVACDAKRVYPLKIETGALPPGRHEVEFYIQIPEFVQPGRYKLKSISVYEVNPLQNVVTGFTTPCFEVVAK